MQLGGLARAAGHQIEHAIRGPLELVLEEEEQLAGSEEAGTAEPRVHVEPARGELERLSNALEQRVVGELGRALDEERIDVLSQARAHLTLPTIGGFHVGLAIEELGGHAVGLAERRDEPADEPQHPARWYLAALAAAHHEAKVEVPADAGS